ncbi:MAG: hypothetical protein U0793_21885 [Gemmataceae bacterium]
MRKALLVALACLLPASAARAQVELEPKDALLHHTSCMVSSLALTPDGKTLLAGTMRSPRVIFWDVAKMKERAVHDPHSQHVFHVAMTADGKIAASVGAENSIVVWDVATAKPRNKLDGLRPHKKIVFLAFLPDNKTLITGGQEGDVKIIDTASLEEKGTFRGKVRRLDFAALSPDGKLLAAAPGALADEIQMWDVEARRPKAPIKDWPNPRSAMTFSKDGKLFAAVGGNPEGFVRVWDVETHKPRLTLKHPADVRAVAFDPASKRLACADASTIHLWDLRTGDKLAILKGHALNIEALVFSPDGATLYSGARDARVMIWDVGRIEQK